MLSDVATLFDAGDDGLLHRNGEALVALFGNGNGFELYLEPVVRCPVAFCSACGGRAR